MLALTLPLNAGIPHLVCVVAVLNGGVVWVCGVPVFGLDLPLYVVPVPPLVLFPLVVCGVWNSGGWLHVDCVPLFSSVFVLVVTVLLV